MMTKVNIASDFAQVSFEHIAAEFGTPCYIYSAPMLTQAYQNYTQAFAKHTHLICYAVKANSNLSVMQHLVSLGAGFDIVSEGELERALRVGCDPKKIVFSGVGKSESEIRRALQAGILCFNVESESEFFHIARCAKEMALQARVSLRVNPDVNAHTHPYISTGLKENKFGMSIIDALELYQKANHFDSVELVGIDCHIGSQLTQMAPFLEAFDHLLALVDKLAGQGIYLQHIDIGGGVGIVYQDEASFPLIQYAEAILEKLGKRRLTLIMEPGRALVGNAGVLLTQVQYLKVNEGKHFAIVDAAMTELMRPALYQAWHDITVLNPTADTEHLYDIVGPVCESADFLGKARSLAIKEGDLLLIHNAGAYASSMGSGYNSRPKVPEVMVDELGIARLIRSRETYQDMLANEIAYLNKQ
jgi:diaminopimelate decarboxylase